MIALITLVWFFILAKNTPIPQSENDRLPISNIQTSVESETEEIPSTKPMESQIPVKSPNETDMNPTQSDDGKSESVTELPNEPALSNKV